MPSSAICFSIIIGPTGGSQTRPYSISSASVLYRIGLEPTENKCDNIYFMVFFLTPKAFNRRKPSNNQLKHGRVVSFPLTTLPVSASMTPPSFSSYRRQSASSQLTATYDYYPNYPCFNSPWKYKKIDNQKVIYLFMAPRVGLEPTTHLEHGRVISLPFITLPVPASPRPPCFIHRMRSGSEQITANSSA